MIIISDRSLFHQSSEKLMPLGFIGAELRSPFEPIGTPFFFRAKLYYLWNTSNITFEVFQRYHNLAHKKTIWWCNVSKSRYNYIGKFPLRTSMTVHQKFHLKTSMNCAPEIPCKNFHILCTRNSVLMYFWIWSCCWFFLSFYYKAKRKLSWNSWFIRFSWDMFFCTLK